MSHNHSLLNEINLVFKNKDMLLLLFVGPIFLTLLFGGVYLNSYVNDIPIAVLDEDNSSMSRMIIQQFSENDRFAVKYYCDSKDQLKDLIDGRKVHMGIYIPHNFANDITTLQSSEALVIVDGTNIIIGNNAYAQAATIIQTIAAGTQIKLLEAKDLTPQSAQNMAMVFNFNDRTLYDPRMTYMNYLLLGFVAVFLQQVMVSGIGSSILKDTATIAEGNIVVKVLWKIAACSIFALTSTGIALGIASKVFKVAIRGNLLIGLLMCCAFILAISCPAIMFAAITRDKVKLSQISFMLSLPTFVSCGYVWPADQMPVILVNVLKIFWPLINFARPFDELLFKGVSPHIFLKNILELLLYTAVWMPIALLVLKMRFKNVKCRM